MTTRTVKIYGLGYGPTGADATITFDGTTVFTGTVPSVNAPVPVDGTPSDDDQLICSFEIPMDIVGTKPMTYSIDSGTCVVLQRIEANYGVVPTAAKPISNGPTEFYNIAGIDTKEDPRTNVYISGVEQNPTRSPTQTGTWSWNLFRGDTMTCDVTIGAATDQTS